MSYYLFNRQEILQKKKKYYIQNKEALKEKARDHYRNF